MDYEEFSKAWRDDRELFPHLKEEIMMILNESLSANLDTPSKIDDYVESLRRQPDNLIKRWGNYLNPPRNEKNPYGYVTYWDYDTDFFRMMKALLSYHALYNIRLKEISILPGWEENFTRLEYMYSDRARRKVAVIEEYEEIRGLAIREKERILWFFFDCEKYVPHSDKGKALWAEMKQHRVNPSMCTVPGSLLINIANFSSIILNNPRKPPPDVARHYPNKTSDDFDLMDKWVPPSSLPRMYFRAKIELIRMGKEMQRELIGTANEMYHRPGQPGYIEALHHFDSCI